MVRDFGVLSMDALGYIQRGDVCIHFGQWYHVHAHHDGSENPGTTAHGAGSLPTDAWKACLTSTLQIVWTAHTPNAWK